MKKLMLMSPGLFGQDPTQMSQMSQLLPMMLMDSEDNSKSKMLMMSMMQNPNMDINQIMPLLMAE